MFRYTNTKRAILYHNNHIYTGDLIRRSEAINGSPFAQGTIPQPSLPHQSTSVLEGPQATLVDFVGWPWLLLPICSPSFRHSTIYNERTLQRLVNSTWHRRQTRPGMPCTTAGWVVIPCGRTCGSSPTRRRTGTDWCNCCCRPAHGPGSARWCSRATTRTGPSTWAAEWSGGRGIGILIAAVGTLYTCTSM